jgi:predicted component of type VI protein secretion system
VERERQIENDLGIKEEQYLNEVTQEYERLRKEREDDFGDLLEEAFEIVDERHDSKDSEE